MNGVITTLFLEISEKTLALDPVVCCAKNDKQTNFANNCHPWERAHEVQRTTGGVPGSTRIKYG